MSTTSEGIWDEDPTGEIGDVEYITTHTHQGDEVEGNSADVDKGEVMHPNSYLSRTGREHATYGMSPQYPLSPRYMQGYVEGRARWDALIALVEG